MNSPAEILKALKRAKRILVPLHVNTDGDSVGSALTLYHLFKRWGRKAEVVAADPLPKSLFFLPGVKKIKEVDPAELDLSRYDLFAILDNGSLSRFSRSKSFRIPPDLTLINIDHHPNNKKFGDLNRIIPSISSTAEILFDLLKEWGIKMDRKIAQCLLTGIFTDTSGFQNERTTPESLEKAAELIRLGADRLEIITNIYLSWSPTALSLWARALKNLRIKERFIYSTLTREEIEKSGIEQQEVGSARSFALEHLIRAVRNIDAAALFSEEREGKVHCSLRSRLGFNAGRVAEKMGGGGHAHAAAFETSGKMERVVDKTLGLVKDMLK